MSGRGRSARCSTISAGRGRRSRRCPRWRSVAAQAASRSFADALREIASAHKLGVTFVALSEPDHPARLQMIDDAPPLVAIRGNAMALARPTVAMVPGDSNTGIVNKAEELFAGGVLVGHVEHQRLAVRRSPLAFLRKLPNTRKPRRSGPW